MVLFVAAILRLWNLGGIPPHLRNDEASFGYDAYSILSTGRDQHGEFLPILFKSFGDFKPGFYIYLTVPFVAMLGLNEWAIRLPAAISGILGVYLLYLVVWNLFKNQKIALASAFSLSISPWHIAFSRGAWEAQVTVTLVLAGLLFFIKALNQNNKYLVFSTGFFGVSLLMSHGAKPAIPLLLLSFLPVYWKKIIKIPFRIVLLSSFLFIMLSLPIIFSFFNGKSTRVAFLLFTNKYQNAKVETIARDFLNNWSNHYSLPILFIKGDGNPQHSAADFGAFITLDIVFLFLGLKTLVNFKDVKGEAKVFILILLILAPLSSTLTSEGVNFERYLMFFILINIILGLGISNFKRNLFWGIFLLLYLFSFLLFLDAYFIHTSAKNGAWQTGYKEIVQFITPIQENFQKIYIPQGGDQPYIFFLLYQRYSPEKFQAFSASVNIPNGSGTGMDYISKLDNIEFVDLNKFNPPLNQSFLIVLPVNNTYKFEGFLKSIHGVKDPIGFPIYKIDEYVPKRL
ncbi:MAG: glycosyltransferase family 39 protein [Candidatus Daviesbacteria bacterium]|nr:glycosyltransferase family 39 protein [Candidatus Daviesbacteria bacterium]